MIYFNISVILTILMFLWLSNKYLKQGNDKANAFIFIYTIYLMGITMVYFQKQTQHDLPTHTFEVMWIEIWATLVLR